LTHAKLIIPFLLFFSIVPLLGQTQNFDVETAIEALFALPEDKINYEELYERYLLLFESPLDLNKADYSALKALHAFSEDEIQRILAYQDSVQTIFSIYELSYIPQLRPGLIQSLSPFLTVEPYRSKTSRSIWSDMLSHQNAYLIMRYTRRLELSNGYRTGVFAGSPDQYYWRYRNSDSEHYSIGITAEKDPGEAMIWDPQTYRYHMDYWSAHFMLKNRGRMKGLIIGDYQLQFGQGLVFSSGLGIGKGAETINTIERVYNGIRPYTSVIEGGFLRGAALTYELAPKVTITPFYSDLRQDATLRFNNDSTAFFSSFQLRGLHRTANEINRKNRVRERLYGANLKYQSRNLNQVGILYQASQYSVNINRGDEPLDLYEFSGKQNANLSAYGNFQLNQFRFFGEFAVSQNKATGLLTGIAGKLTPRLESVLLLRRYDKSFHSLRSGAFGEGSRNINESGIYLGLKYTFNRKFFATAYYDRFFSEWLRFRTQRPSKGFDYLVRLNYRPTDNSQLYFQYRFKQKERNTVEANQRAVLPGKSNRFILHLDHIASKHLSIRSKVQWSNYSLNSAISKGIAFFQDINYDLGKIRLSGRFSIFDTEGGDNRQYAYERDLLYTFSIPGLSGRGIRNYLLVQFSPSHHIRFWLKFSRTTYYDRDEIGTGVDRINSPHITDIRIQTMIKF
jgi:hypothetical protein